jgi:hypothetical protein
LVDCAEADDILVATKSRHLVDDIFSKKSIEKANEIKVGDRITWYVQTRANDNELSKMGKIIVAFINLADFNHILIK